MKKLRFIAMAGLVACCALILGSQSSAVAQGKSGKSRGNSSMGERRSTGAIQRGIDNVTRNRADRNRTEDRDDDRDNNRQDDNRNMRNSRNRRHSMHTNNGVRDYGRGIGRGKGQGKGRGYARRTFRNRNH